MKIDHVRFYVEDATALRDWFVQILGFQCVFGGASSDTRTEVVKSGSVCFILSSPIAPTSPVAKFLRLHPPGVADLAFRVPDVESVMERARSQGAKVLQPIRHFFQDEGYVKWGKITGWGSLSHTLIEASGNLPVDIGFLVFSGNKQQTIDKGLFTAIDHVVLNVPAGDLDRAVAWYKNTLSFLPQQSFAIQTKRSGLHSKVMVHPDGWVKLPINEPSSANSQIQEFLDVNRGSGIQHIALQTPEIVQAIARLRASGLPFLSVPPTYYTDLQNRQGLDLSKTELQEIAKQQILVDWEKDNPQALLLQTFTQPIFPQPTFFFELIERRFQAQGFGEGNFRALFEAIERDQMQRGSLEDGGLETGDWRLGTRGWGLGTRDKGLGTR